MFRETLLLAWLLTATSLAFATEPVDFGRDIRPLLSDRCFKCHGPDRAGQENDLQLDSRAAAIEGSIVPGRPDESELIARIISADPELKMPPANSERKALTPQEVELFRRWIQEGAKYEEHWAYRRPVKAALPAVEQTSWPINEIDLFVLQRMEAEEVRPAPEAERRTLIRRLNFDLLGLPPTPDEVDRFIGDRSANAYEELVDRLLASEHFGERLAQYWLDLVRYADTDGYHADNPREVDAYRDYVIDAFNHNLPFDEFTIEQLAGDLLPQPTTQQKIASGYNRMLQTTREGGAQAKEYIAIYQADRVRNVASVWLAATMGCCQCHDHKFDPLSIRDFYSMGAFFADVKQVPVGTQPPNLFMPTPEQTEQIHQLQLRIDELRATPVEATAVEVWIAEQRELQSGSEKKKTARKKIDAATKKLLDDLAAVLKKPVDELNDADRRRFEQLYRGLAEEHQPVRQQLIRTEKELQTIRDQVRDTLITEAVEPRQVRVLLRGNWMDDSGEIVRPDIPHQFGTLYPREQLPTRLDLAHWIVTPENPLTARVFVNRLWKLTFGNGIARTLEDLGYQGEWPTHPELLDWLAVDFVEHGWDVKRLVRQLVLSRTYRQSSSGQPGSRERDPFNQLLARQSRFRLSAEAIRDNALAVSGLLVETIGGPSVKPYQPAGYWQHLNFPPREWEANHGAPQYRRGLYTFWCRSFLHPSLLAFDATTREECTADRSRSNTPLQALVLLNDPTYVEAARVLAAKICTASGEDQAHLQNLYRQILQRQPSQAESTVLLHLLKTQRRHYAAAPLEAKAVQTNGDSPAAAGVDEVELAAWTAVTRAILNLHETITRN